jgi:hypothetical protein
LLRPHRLLFAPSMGEWVEQTTSLVTNERERSGINGATGAQHDCF